MNAPAAPALVAAPARMSSLSYGLFRGAVVEGPPAPSIALPPLRRKRWVYVAVCDPRFVVGVAVADLGYAANAFAYAGRIGGDGPRAWKSLAAPWAATVGRRHARWARGADALAVTLPDGPSAGSLRGAVDVGGGVTARFDLALTAAAAPTAVTCVAPAGDDARGRWNLTVKDNTLAAAGVVRWGSETLEVSAPALYDVTDAYAPRRTVWHWASLAGHDREGRRVGVNLCALHNDSDRARENVAWVGGDAHPLGPVRFAFDRAAPAAAPWRITGDGVDLRFEPAGARVGDEDLVVVKSRFVQPYGLFHGEVRAGADVVRLDGAPGVVEDHEALW